MSKFNLGSDEESYDLGWRAVPGIPCETCQEDSTRDPKGWSEYRIREGSGEKAHTCCKGIAFGTPPTKVLSAKVKEDLGTSLSVYPNPRYSLPGCPYLAKVRDDHTVPIVVECNDDVHRFAKAGSTVAQYEICPESLIDSSQPVFRT